MQRDLLGSLPQVMPSELKTLHMVTTGTDLIVISVYPILQGILAPCGLPGEPKSYRVVEAPPAKQPAASNRT